MGEWEGASRTIKVVGTEQVRRFLSSSVSMSRFDFRIMYTGGSQAESRKGGRMSVSPHPFSMITGDELRRIYEHIVTAGGAATLYEPGKRLSAVIRKRFHEQVADSVFLVIHKMPPGVPDVDADAAYREARGIQYDEVLYAKKYVREGNAEGRATRRARTNAIIADERVAPDLKNGQGVVHSFEDLPYARAVRERLAAAFRRTPIIEVNKYPLNGGYIGEHGDVERPEGTLGFSMGFPMNLSFRAYFDGAPLEPLLEVPIRHGDMYAISGYLGGANWLRKTVLTWRHAAVTEQTEKQRTPKRKAWTDDELRVKLGGEPGGTGETPYKQRKQKTQTLREANDKDTRVVARVEPAPVPADVATLTEHASRIKSVLQPAASAASDDSAAEPALAALENVRATRSSFKASGVGRAVNDLAKARGSLSARARQLVQRWKAELQAEDKDGHVVASSSEESA